MKTRLSNKSLYTATGTNSNSGIIENIKALLDAKEAELNEVKRKSKEEKATIENKIAELESALEMPETLEEYKSISEELKENRQYLRYLEAKKNTLENSAITKEERQAILKDLKKELLRIQEEAAPEMQKKLFEIVELMQEYDRKAKPIQDLANRAQSLDKSSWNPQVVWKSTISEINNDKNNLWGHFVYWFYKYFG